MCNLWVRADTSDPFAEMFKDAPKYFHKKMSSHLKTLPSQETADKTPKKAALSWNQRGFKSASISQQRDKFTVFL